MNILDQIRLKLLYQSEQSLSNYAAVGSYQSVCITYPPIICECNPRALNHRHSWNILRNLEDANTTLVISIGIILLQGGQGAKCGHFERENCSKIRFCGHIVSCAAREVAKTSSLIKTKCVLATLTFPWHFSFDLAAVVYDGGHIKDVQK